MKKANIELLETTTEATYEQLVIDGFFDEKAKAEV